ncbi:MAG: endo-1,4-beta-xylanase [Acidobacteriaceae bacterium]
MIPYRRNLTAVAFAAIAVLPSGAGTPSLKKVLGPAPYIGVAINAAQITGQDAQGDAIIESQFDSISPENVLKWENIHPRPGVYRFSLADKYVAFGEKHHMYIVGHTLVWYQQTPAWVFRDSHGNLVDRDTLLRRMQGHIQTIVGRYKGRVKSWDVVNEALNDDGSLRQTLWYKIIGEDYIAKAFEFAHQADPGAILTYNDYDLEYPRKRAGALALITKLKREGVPVMMVGMQGHVSLTQPSLKQEQDTILAFGRLGVKVAISELDVDVLPRAAKRLTANISLSVHPSAALNPYTNGLPDDVQRRLADRYEGLFRIYLAHRDIVSRVTFWGVTDASSWLNNWPVRGRTNYPLLFDRNGQPAPAFFAVLKAASASAR